MKKILVPFIRDISIKDKVEPIDIVEIKEMLYKISKTLDSVVAQIEEHDKIFYN